MLNNVLPNRLRLDSKRVLSRSVHVVYHFWGASFIFGGLFHSFVSCDIRRLLNCCSIALFLISKL
jgi:hypothetical protein